MSIFDQDSSSDENEVTEVCAQSEIIHDILRPMPTPKGKFDEKTYRNILIGDRLHGSILLWQNTSACYSGADI